MSSESYTYDLTSTLQHNLTGAGRCTDEKAPFNDRFTWNYYMLAVAFGNQENIPVKARWILPLVHGHVDQASEHIFHLWLVRNPCLVSLKYALKYGVVSI
jgi:hypothetical protein